MSGSWELYCAGFSWNLDAEILDLQLLALEACPEVASLLEAYGVLQGVLHLSEQMELQTGIKADSIPLTRSAVGNMTANMSI